MATHITPINPLVCLNQATNKYRTVGKESVTARRLPMELLFNSPVFTTKFCRDRDSNTQVTLLVYVVFFSNALGLYNDRGLTGISFHTKTGNA